jgi:hypothetical protein
MIIHPHITQTLAAERQRDAVRQASRHRLAAQAKSTERSNGRKHRGAGVLRPRMQPAARGCA